MEPASQLGTKIHHTFRHTRGRVLGLELSMLTRQRCQHSFVLALHLVLMAQALQPLMFLLHF
jgi:hypothetical protein